MVTCFYLENKKKVGLTSYQNTLPPTMWTLACAPDVQYFAARTCMYGGYVGRRDVPPSYGHIACPHGCTLRLR
jgi:hypothetical protein